MSTRADNFDSKIQSLLGYYTRLAGSESISTTFASSVCKLLEYFKNTLTSILKEAATQQGSPCPLRSHKDRHVVPLDKRYIFPTLAYFRLYDILVDMLHKLDRLPNDISDVAESMMECLCFTLVFVEESTRIGLPAEVAGMMCQFSSRNPAINQCIMNALCRTIIPVCLGVVTSLENQNVFEDIPSIIICVLESVHNVSLHFYLVETLMLFKDNLWSDIMLAITCSDGLARIYAVQLLFHYWPHLFSPIANEHRLASQCIYKSTLCENPNCSSILKSNIATTAVLDAAFPTQFSGKPPPLYLCHSCTQITLQNIKANKDMEFLDIVLPAECIKHHCENKHCLSKNSVATVTVLGSKGKLSDNHVDFSTNVQKRNLSWHYDHQAMRYCEECYNNLKHLFESLNLVVQLPPCTAWQQNDSRFTRMTLDAVICLLSERVEYYPTTMGNGTAKTTVDDNVECLTITSKNSWETLGVYSCDGCMENMGHQVTSINLSHYGVWLLDVLCPPQPNLDKALVTQLIASVLVWYKNNSLLSSDDCGARLENLKPTFLESWLEEMRDLYFEQFLACLLPNPPPEARVRNHWDSIRPLYWHYKEGINFIICLASYSIISIELWECLIPCWMMALCENLSSDELQKLKDPLNALFDKDLSPLSFRPEQTFAFMLRSFQQRKLIDHENALEWLQILSEVNVFISIQDILTMFSVSESRLSVFQSSHADYHADKDFQANDQQNYSTHSTDANLKKLMSRSSQPCIKPLETIVDGMNVPCSSSCEKDCDSRSMLSMATSENKKSFRRSSSRLGKSKKSSSYFKSKRSFRRRRESSVAEVIEMETLPAPSNVHSTCEPRMRAAGKPVSNKRKLSAEWNRSRIVACYVDMLEILYRQLVIQGQPNHTGVYIGDFELITKLLLNLLTRIVEKREIADGSSSSDISTECVQAHCELAGDFFEAAANLLAVMLPCKMQDRVIKDTRNNWESPSFSNCCLSEASYKMEDFNSFELPVQLLYGLIKALEDYSFDKAVAGHIIKSISYLCLCGNLLYVLSDINSPPMKEFVMKMFIPSLWKQLMVQHSDSSNKVVAILLKCVAILDHGFKSILSLVETTFQQGFFIIEEYTAAKKEARRTLHESKSVSDGKPFESEGDKKEKVVEEPIENWRLQFETLDRIQAFLTSMKDDGNLQSRSQITYLVSHLFAMLLAALRQPVSAIYSKAKFIIDSMCSEVLQLIYTCLLHEFHKSLRDRTFLLSMFLDLHQLRGDASPLSYSRFTHLINILAIESHQKKVIEAISQKDLLRTERGQPYERISTLATFSQRLERAKLLVRMDDDFVKKCHIGGSESYMSAQDSLFEFNFNSKAADSCPGQIKEESQLDIETVDHLMLVICEYLAGSEKVTKELSSSKQLHVFLRQLQTWLTYNEQVGYFTSAPSILRSIIGVSTLLKNLPKILDRNHTFGNIFLPIALALLELIVKTSDKNCRQSESADCRDFDLEVLLEVDQIAWLKTVQVIMYKYTVKEQTQVDQLTHLLYICLSTLRQQFHVCNSKLLGIFSGKNEKNLSKSTSNASTKKRLAKMDTQLSIDKERLTTQQSTQASSSYCKEKAHEEDTVPLLESITAASSRQDIISVVGNSGFDTSQGRQDHSNGENVFPSGEACPNGVSDPAGDMANSPPEGQSDESANGQSEDGRSNEQLLYSRCRQCNAVVKDVSSETLSLCIANLCHFVRYNPTVAVPLLPKLLSQIAHIAEPLCDEKCSDLPPLLLVAKQSMRCIVHQLADHRIFSCLFLIPFPEDGLFFPVLIACLSGYNQFHCLRVLKHTLEDLPEDLNEFSRGDLHCLLSNLASYLFHLRNESCINCHWQPVFNGFSSLFLKLNTYVAKQGTYSIDTMLRVMIQLLRASVPDNIKLPLIEPFSKILSTSVTKSNFSVGLLYQLCTVANGSFSKERDKMYLTRCIVSKLMSALKMNISLLGHNLLLLLQIVLSDCGSRVNSSTMPEICDTLSDNIRFTRGCCTMECMKGYLTDCLDILGDGNFLKNIAKDNTTTGRKRGGSGILKEVHGSDLKLAIAQLVAGQLYINYYNSTQIQSLFHPPSAMQHGLKEYNECVAQIKKLSWILLGSLSHLGLQNGAWENLWYPIPFQRGPSFATIIQVILSGYLKQNKESKMNMTSLFYAFLFCQLWTVYCEQMSYFMTSSISSSQGDGSVPTTTFTGYNPVGDHHGADMLLYEFWSRVTSSMLVLMEHDEMLSENIQRHIASSIECLQHYDSSILFKLYPMWSPMLDILRDQDSQMMTQQYFNWRNPPSTVVKKSRLSDGSFLSSNGMDQTVEDAASINAQRVLGIVESINGKLVKIEKCEGVCIV